MDSATRYWVVGWVVGSAGTWSWWIPATTTGSATIRHVTLTSSPASGDTYRTGEKIRAELTWSQVVTVDNGGSDDNVAVRLDLGSDDGAYSNSRRAMSYVSGTGSDTLTFEYTVQRDDIDADGVWVQHKSATENEVVFLANGATLEGGNPDTNNAGLTRRHRLGTTGDPSQKVDGTTTATADAGADRTVLFGTEVTLNGGGSSSENEGASLTYAWNQLSGEPVTLSGANTAKPSFTAPTVRTDLVFQLVVNDGAYDSGPDTVTIVVRAPLNPSSPPCAHPAGGGKAQYNVSLLVDEKGDTSIKVYFTTANETTFSLCRPDGSRISLLGAANEGRVTFSDLSSGTRYWIASGTRHNAEVFSQWVPVTVVLAEDGSNRDVGDVARPGP